MSGLIPQSEIDKANQDIVEVIRGYVPDLKKTGKNWSACCPFHQEKSPSFTVSEDKEMFYCFGCGASGNALGFVMQHEKMNFRDAVSSINGGLNFERGPMEQAKTAKVIRAIRCELPGHAEDRERTATVLAQCTQVEQHVYLMKNNTASNKNCLTLKGSLIVALVNNIGEEVNAAAISSKGVSYAAGKPSFGSTAILEPEGEHDGKTIMCVDYAHAWRIWWAQRGKSRVLACMDAGNFRWMLGACRDRFTHVGCDPSEADEHVELGRPVVAVPADPYARIDRALMHA